MAERDEDETEVCFLRIGELEYLVQCTVMGRCCQCDRDTRWRLVVADVHVCGKRCFRQVAHVIDSSIPRGHGKLPES